MADDLKMKLGIDTGQAVGDLHKAAGAADDLTSALDDNRSAAQKVADEINSATDKIVAQLKSDVDAADALAKAMGPELLSTADGGIQGLIAKLKDLGLTSDQIKADAQALGDAFKRSDEAVDELKRLDGELDQIDADAKTAKTAVANIGDADVSGASAGVHHLGDEIGEVDNKTARAKDASRSFAGAAVGDSLAAATGMGALGESVSQVTEGLLEGEVGLKGLATAGLGLGAVAGGMLLVNKLLGTFQQEAAEAAKIKAFNVQNAKEFVDAVTAGNDVVQHYIDLVKQSGKVEVAPNAKQQTEALKEMGLLTGNLANSADQLRAANIGVSHGIQDIGDDLIAAGQSAETFYAAALDPAKFAAFEASVKNSNLPLADQAQLISGLIYQQEQFAAGNDKLQKTQALTALAQDQVNTNAAEGASLLDGLTTSTASLTTATDGQTTAQDKATTAADNNRKALDAQKQSTQNLIDTERSAIDAKFAERKATQDFTDAQREQLDSAEGVVTAQQNVNAAVKKYGEDSPEAKKATEDLTAAQLNLRDRQDATFESVLSLSEAHVKAKGAALDSKAGIDLQIQSLQAEADTLAPTDPLRQRIAEYIADLKNIPTQIATDLHLSVTGDNPSNFLGGRGAHAVGGTVGPREVFSQIDEEGPEILTLPGGTQVMTARATAAYLAAAQRANAGSTTINNFTITTHPGLSARDLAAELRRRARRNGTAD